MAPRGVRADAGRQSPARVRVLALVCRSQNDRDRACHTRWGNPFYGTCNPVHFRKTELSEVGVFALDPARVDHFFPHLALGIVHAISDISIVENMEIDKRELRHHWRRPDGRLELIVYPPAPNLIELAQSSPRTLD